MIGINFPPPSAPYFTYTRCQMEKFLYFHLAPLALLPDNCQTSQISPDFPQISLRKPDYPHILSDSLTSGGILAIGNKPTCWSLKGWFT